MHNYQFGDFVFGVSADVDSVFCYEDFLLAMVVEPNPQLEPGNMRTPLILLLCSTFLDERHSSCTKPLFIEEVKRIRDNPSLYSTSLFMDKYQDFVMPPDEIESIVPFSPTRQGYTEMLTQMKILHDTFGDSIDVDNPFLSFEEFSSRYLSPGFLSTSPKLSL